MAATYDNLPVFKACYDLLFVVIAWCAKMTKDFRYTIGEELKRRLIDVEIAIYRANSEKSKEGKIENIYRAQELMVEVKLYIRILHDAKQLSTKHYAMASQMFVEVDKHLMAWRKYNLS